MCSICCKGFQGVLVGGCTCLKCTNKAEVPIVLLVQLRQLHPLERQLHPLERQLHPLLPKC